MIVVVDDEASICRALTRLMLSAGLNVEAFTLGSELFDFLKTRSTDCIVLDLHMPGMSGFEVQERLLREGYNIPIVAITGHDTPEAQQRVMSAGAKAYLRKPVREKVLLDAVRAAIKTNQQP